MDINNCLDDIKKIEANLGGEIQSRLSGFYGQEKYVATLIVNDTVDLVEDISRDNYMFNLSLDNYNNHISFMPQYYFENIILRDDMIWERILIIIAIAYEIEFEDIFIKKGIFPLYESIKKNQNVSSKIKELLLELNGNYKFKQLKITRNGNEHYVSSHLADGTENEKFKGNLHEIIYIENGELYVDMCMINKLKDDMHYNIMLLLKSKINDILKKKAKYINLMTLCIVEMEKTFKKSDILYFKQMNYFIPESELGFVNKNIMQDCSILEDKYDKLREKLRIIIDKKNENAFAILEEGEQIRDTLLIDSLFRAKEMIRSINLFFLCTSYNIYGEVCVPFSVKDFHKYCDNKLISSHYHYDHAMLKLYSVYEKVAKFILCKYDFDKEYIEDSKFKNMYIEKILDIFNSKTFSTKIIEKFKQCVTCNDFIKYENIRNKEYHRIRTRYFNNNSSYEVLNISIMKNAMDSLYELFEMIIEEEKLIFNRMINDRRA